MRDNRQKQSNIKDFTTGNVPKQLVSFAAPLFLSSLLQIVYNMVDMIIVGQKLGKVGLSAVSVGGDVTSFLTFIAMGFSSAGQVIISQYLGSGQKEKISRFIGTMLNFLMGIALLISIVCMFLRRQMLTVMNTPPEAFSEAMNYSTICIAGLVFIYGYNIVSAVLRGMGDSVRPFIFIGIAAVGNVILDVLFVLVMGMGSRGAALATVLSQAFSFMSCAAYIFRNKAKYDLSLTRAELTAIDTAMLSGLVKLGLPMAIKFASVMTSKLFVNAFVNSYGVAVSAFSGIAHKIGSITNLLSNAFNTAGSSMVGQNIGAERYERVGAIMRSIFAITVSIDTVLSALMILFPAQIIGLFTSEPDVISIGIRYVPIAVLTFYSSAARSGMNALINGSGNYRVNFATAILDGIIMRIGLALLFGLALGMKHYGFWLGDALAGFTPFFIGTVFYFSGRWKQKTV
ncbi:MAG: MATE family efflux transporter [Mogibacterium sp.]|nr:MATE family efflux transporter [Mogibacterium sp.]